MWGGGHEPMPFQQLDTGTGKPLSIAFLDFDDRK